MEKKIKYSFFDERFFFLKDLNDHSKIFFLTNKEISLKKISFFLGENFIINDFQNEISINQNLISFWNSEKNFSILNFNFLEKYIPSKNNIENGIIEIKVNDEINIEKFSKKLINFNFEFNEIPEINQFSVKGERIDIGIDFNLTLRIYIAFDKIEEIKLQSIDYDLKIENLIEYKIYNRKIQNTIQFYNLISSKDLIIYDNIDVEDFNMNKNFYSSNDSMVFSFI